MFKSKITGKRQITIPIEIFKELGLTTEDSIGFRKGKSGLYEVVKIEANPSRICNVCGEEVSLSSGNVNIQQRMYHIGCWFDLSDIEKLKKIIFNHSISDKDCAKILSLTNSNFEEIINIYSDKLEHIETDNIAKVIIDLLK